jgi:trimethylamine--corrinoid protein Co-methyltransferase
MEITLRLFEKKHLDRIHQASLEILETVGIMVDHEKILKLLYDAGAKIKDRKNKIVLFNEKLVKGGLRKAPSYFKLSDRAGGYKEITPGEETTFWTPCVKNVFRDGVSREMRAKDLIDFTRVVDALENVFGVVGASVSDYPPQVQDFVGFRLMAEHTYKHLRPIAFAPEGVDAVIEMAQVLVDGGSLRDDPILSLGHSSVTPFTWTNLGLERFYRSRGHGIPISVHAGPLVGGISPVTLAGTLAVANAEVLAGIAINQLLEEGRPCFYNLGFGRVFDMRTAIGLAGSAEVALLAAAGSQLSRYYNLPSAAWSNTESMLVDSQSIYERTMMMLLFILARINMVWGIGQLESEISVSLEQAVIDDEIIGPLKRIQRGIEIDDETLALEVIKEVGFPLLSGKNYLEHEHTTKHFKEEMFFPKLSNRKTREDWLALGGKTLEDQAKRRCKEILRAEKKIYITEKQKQELLKIEKKYTNILTGK